jgi:ABC-type sugar transport system permease subunit
MAIVRQNNSVSVVNTTPFYVHVFDCFMILTLLAAAAALAVLGILALIAYTPFHAKSLATGVVFLVIASACVLSIFMFTIYIGSRHERRYIAADNRYGNNVV